MRNLVDAVLVNIEAASIQELVAMKIEAEDILEEIRSDLESVKPEISFWERLNIFETSENEERELQYRRELLAERRHLNALQSEIREIIVAAIDRTFSARLKLNYTILLRQAESLKAKGNSKVKIKGKSKLMDLLVEMDKELSDRFGFEYGLVKEEELVEAIIERLGA